MLIFRQIIFQKIPVHKNLRRRSVPGGVGFVLKTPPHPVIQPHQRLRKHSITSRSRSVNRFAVMRSARPDALSLCPVSCVFHASRCLISPRIRRFCSRSFISVIHPVIAVSGPFFLFTKSTCGTLAFCCRIKPFRFLVMTRLAQWLMVPFGPEENIITAINRDNVIHHHGGRIYPLLKASHA